VRHHQDTDFFVDIWGAQVVVNYGLQGAAFALFAIWLIDKDPFFGVNQGIGQCVEGHYMRDSAL
jgi:hypothetical protein